MMKLLQQKLPLILLVAIIFLAGFLRINLLGDVPNGLSNDEASYIYSAYSAWKTGKGIDGTFLPLSFNTDSSNSPVPIYIDAPFVGILGVSPFSGRLPYALAGLGSVILVFLITKQLFNNKWIGLSTAFVMAISPWHLQVSRAAFDTTIALFFYLMGIYLFIKNIKKGNILWSLIPFLLAFYSYHALKFFFLFFLPFLLLLYWKDLQKQKITRTLFVAGYLLILLSFFGVIIFGHENRQDTTLLSFSNADVVKTVNYERSTSLAPNNVKNVFNNKLLTILRTVRENFLEPFSPQYLFLYGDTSSGSEMLGLYSRGEMYIIELPLLLIGIIALSRKQSFQKKLFIFVSLGIAVLPTTFTIDKSYVLRSLMMIPFLSVLVGLGIYEVFVWKFPKKYRYVKVGGIVLIGFVYLLLVASYFYQYYGRYPVYGADAWKHDSRIVSKYLLHNSPKYKNVYVLNENILLLQYGILGQINPQLIQKVWNNSSPEVGNIHFHADCPMVDGIVKRPLPRGSLLVVNGASCPLKQQPIFQVKSQVHTGEVLWTMYQL